MPESVDELKRLSPRERIKRLKEIEEERKKEIEQAEELIKETVREIADAEEKKKIPIPQARATDASALATVEEKQIVATHHLTVTEAALTAAQPQQPKSLEEVAAEEGLVGQQQAQQPQQFQSYAIGAGQQKSAFGEYVRASQRTVTGGGAPAAQGPISPMEEKVTEFYRERALTGAENPDDKMGQSYKTSPVTGGYDVRRAEEGQRKEQSEFYRRRGGPA